MIQPQINTLKFPTSLRSSASQDLPDHVILAPGPEVLATLRIPHYPDHPLLMKIIATLVVLRSTFPTLYHKQVEMFKRNIRDLSSVLRELDEEIYLIGFYDSEDEEIQDMILSDEFKVHPKGLLIVTQLSSAREKLILFSRKFQVPDNTPVDSGEKTSKDPSVKSKPPNGQVRH
ncbi:hypothetical protein CVT24_011669 [Panaeolus cyanescens]|uniref:Uncharacterized protein n=1 Tax=Panaeolus cyanescens TaxID=181874 RepID=A0A409YH53_9AGAR|nr:hypothetical protein CVT24_011669 [Panaeolus cyanescens]